MSLDLLNQLEAKVQTTVDALNQLRQEVEQLKEENTSLKEEKQAWESKLGDLLNKFSSLEATAQETTLTSEVTASDEEGSSPSDTGETQVSRWS
ncbi:cell division protein ZapB [Marinospirillum sp.]|uniref:cell division protein ZapB n=1 Tax=Marinospirillum sp. TaxID=2183934 RepID=UPI0038511178